MNVPPAASGAWPEEHCTLTTDTGLGGSTWGEMKSQGFSFTFFLVDQDEFTAAAAVMPTQPFCIVSARSVTVPLMSSITEQTEAIQVWT